MSFRARRNFTALLASPPLSCSQPSNPFKIPFVPVVGACVAFRMESAVRATIRTVLVLATLVACVAVCSSLKANSIEAVKGKHYKLTKRHGPWMIMVASFLQPPEGERGEGISPDEAAEQLVYELRKKGIPAYTFKQNGVEREIKAISRRTQEERAARFKAWSGGICVLAGNYTTSNDSVAQRTLKYVKQFQPQFLGDVATVGKAGPGELVTRSKNGGVFRTTPYRPGPLSGAFMTTNPLLSDEEIVVHSRDPLVLQLNSGNEYSLLQNPAKYTVVVATFQGKYVLQATGDTNKKERELEISSALDDAAKRAWELCTALRHAKSLGYDREFEAYVYHDRFSSIVTIGGFQSKDDPRIAEIQNTFGAKVSSVQQDGSPSFGAEVFAVPKRPTRDQPMKTWIFDPFPQVMDVPK